MNLIKVNAAADGGEFLHFCLDGGLDALQSHVHFL